jgi:hypothetical protein
MIIGKGNVKYSQRNLSERESLRTVLLRDRIFTCKALLDCTQESERNFMAPVCAGSLQTARSKR